VGETLQEDTRGQRAWGSGVGKCREGVEEALPGGLSASWILLWDQAGPLTWLWTPTARVQVGSGISVGDRTGAH
jgi:hypothetical protein